MNIVKQISNVVLLPSNNQPFKIISDFKESGDQPSAIQNLIKNIQEGDNEQVLLGVTGSGKTFTMAKVIESLQRPTLIMAPNKTLAAQLYGEMKSLFPNNKVEYFVSYYDYYQPEAYLPSRDILIEKEATINEEIDKLRHSATKSLLTKNDVVVVASVSAIYGLGAPSEYMGFILDIKLSDKISMKSFMKNLIEMQYERNDFDFSRGCFRVRGDVIDIFPAENSETAIRVTLFDDVIEGISTFDPLTGQIFDKVKRQSYWVL